MILITYVLIPLLSLLGFTDAKRTATNSAFDVGERLVFDINYGFVTAGQAVMVIPGFKYVNGHKAFEINTYAVSSEAFDNIFKVRDKYSSFVDVDGIYPH